MKKIIGLGLLVAMLSMIACQSTSNAKAEAVSNAELKNTLWKLTILNGEKVDTATGRQMASLTLSSEQSEARIVTACNRGNATYKLDGTSIKFAVAMSTKMGCESAAMQQETAFFDIIAATDHFEISGDTLVFYAADNKLLASFQAEYLK